MHDSTSNESASTQDDEVNRRANEKSAKRKAARDKILATKTIEKGLLMVHTGKGKGKSTAAFGMVVRAIGNGLRVGVVQFVKGKWQTGERAVLERFPDQCEIRTMGEGFTWETQDRARDIEAAKAAWGVAQEMIEASRGPEPTYDMVLLDELNIVLRYDYLPLDEVVATLGGASAQPARNRHWAQCKARADRRSRPRHRDDHDQAPISRRC